MRCRIIAAAVLVYVVMAVAPAWGQGGVPAGAGRFSVPGAAPDGTPVRVWSYRPANFGPTDRIVIVMHGVLRNADRYRDTWIAAAKSNRLLVLAPEMSKAQFPAAAGYNLGNMVDRDGDPLPPERWAWGVVEKVFDAARQATGSQRQSYALYGHSAGAQFVHRLVLFSEDARFDVAISANAGWYTLPTAQERFPYGLDRAPADPARVRHALARPLVVMLGGDDTDSEDENLRQTKAALRQGQNRLERGQTFMRVAKSEAERTGSLFAWRLDIVPDVDHDAKAMVSAALRWVLSPPR